VAGSSVNSLFFKRALYLSQSVSFHEHSPVFLVSKGVSGRSDVNGIYVGICFKRWNDAEFSEFGQVACGLMIE